MVEGPESRLGGVRRQGQALLALPQAQVVAPAGERVAEDLRDELQPLHQRVRPVALRPQGVEGQRADRRLASQREREGQVRPEPEAAGALPVDGKLRRHLVHGADHDRTAGHHLGDDPRVLLVVQRLGRWYGALGVVGVRGQDDGRVRARPLPEHGQIDAERLADPAQRVHDLAVQLVRRQVDEPGREVGDQRLEPDGVPEVEARRGFGAVRLGWTSGSVGVRHDRARVYALPKAHSARSACRVVARRQSVGTTAESLAGERLERICQK